MKQNSFYFKTFYACIFLIAFACKMINAQMVDLPIGANGWSILTPSSDSRLMYVSNDGSDATGVIYSASDPEIGSDPQNPVGTIHAFGSIGAAQNQMRAGMPDWILLKRGDEWSGTMQLIDGRSGSERSVICAYGSGNRPKLLIPAGEKGINKTSAYNNIVIMDLHMEGADGLTPYGIRLFGKGENTLIENCFITKTRVGMAIEQRDNMPNEPYLNIDIRRSIFYLNYEGNISSTQHSQGIFALGINHFTIDECVFDHNGWIPGGREPDIFCHNMYLAGKISVDSSGVSVIRFCGSDNTLIRNTISARASANGIQARSGGVSDNCLYLNNSIAGFVGDDDPDNICDEALLNNVSIHAALRILDEDSPNEYRGFGLQFNGFDGIGQNLGYNNIACHSDPPARQHYIENEDHEHADFENNIAFNWGDMPDEPFGASYPDTTRTVMTYAALQGIAPTIEAFLEEARKFDKGNWRTEYTAKAFNNYIREGFGLNSDCDGNTPPSASFSYNPTSGLTAPIDISFNGTGTDVDGDDLFYYWSFDDGTHSSLEDVVHNYEYAGNYNVSLKVTDGCDYDIATQLIDISGIEQLHIIPDHDSYVNSNPDKASLNLNDQGFLALKNAGTYDFLESFLRFDISGINPDSVSKAELKMQLLLNNNTDKDVIYEVRVVSNDTWTETTITHDNRPPVGAVMTTDTLPASWVGEVTLDMMSAIQSAEAQDGLLSIALVPLTTDTKWYYFCSKEGDFKPELNIVQGQVACGNVTGVTISQSSVSITETQTIQLSKTVLPSNACDKSVSWSSNNNSVATVDANGLVTAVSTGSATITVTTNDGGFTDYCSVTVTSQSVPVTGITLNENTVDLTVGSNFQLVETVSPVTATDKSVAWSSNNTSVATVNASGLVQAVSAGTAVITVTTNDGGFTDNCTINVSTGIIPVTGVTLDKSSVNILIGTTSQLNETVLPANATDKSVVWSTDNASIATINASGLVTGVAEGSTVITVTTNDGGYTDNCTVNVSAGGTGTEVTLATWDYNGLGGQSLVTAQFYDGGLDAAAPSLNSEVGPGLTALNYLGGGLTANGQKALTLASAIGASDYISFTVGPDAGSNLTLTEIQFRPVTQNRARNFALLSSVNGFSDGNEITDIVVPKTQFNGNMIVIPLSGHVNLTSNVEFRLYIYGADIGGEAVGLGNGDDEDLIVKGYLNGSASIPVTGVSLDITSLTLTEGNGAQLSATVQPVDATDQTISWETSNSSVATVDANGYVTSVAAGNATITVTTNDGGYTDQCVVTVNPLVIPVTGVDLDFNSLSIGVGSTAQLTETVIPANASNKSVNWSSDNELVATVDANGLVSAIAIGSATITVTTVDGGFTDNCTISVTQPILTDLALWDFAGYGGYSSVAAQYSETGISTTAPSVVAEVGPGLTALNYLGNGLTANGQKALTLSGAISGNDYFTFSLTPEIGNLVTVTEIQYRPVTQNRARTFVLFSSVDGFTEGQEISSILVPKTQFNGTIIEIPVSDHENLTSNVEFRVYIYGADIGGESVGFGNGDGDDLIVKGYVSADGLKSGAIATNIANSNPTQHSVACFPNPSFDGKLNLRFNGFTNEDKAELSIYDLSGRIIYSENLYDFNSTKEINLGNELHSSCYIVRIKTKNIVLTERVLIH